MMWTNDPERDFARWDAEMAEREAKCPYCEECGQKITSGYIFEIYGEYYHEDCFIKEHRMEVEDYLERV